jgi:hypothetical protein
MSRRFVFNLTLEIFLSLLVLCTCACLYVKWQTYQTKKNAGILLADLREMKVGDTTLDSVRQLAGGSQSRFLVKGIDPFCQDTFCTYTFGYHTDILARLVLWHLHPWRLDLTPAPTDFHATLVVQGNRLVRVEMLLTSDIPSMTRCPK